MSVIFLPEVLDYFNELTTILYRKDYFGFEENALKYVDELVYDIEQTLPLRVKKPAPIYFDKFGKKMFYCAFPKNKQTTWYVFFSIYQVKNERTYLVRHISNNHLIAKYL